uniref:Uncharacterized protein n=1 Tax=Arundo donax TaxID=35708 RepID=A0A0A9G7L5_ARUDO
MDAQDEAFTAQHPFLSAQERASNQMPPNSSPSTRLLRSCPESSVPTEQKGQRPTIPSKSGRILARKQETGGGIHETSDARGPPRVLSAHDSCEGTGQRILGARARRFARTQPCNWPGTRKEKK